MYLLKVQQWHLLFTLFFKMRRDIFWIFIVALIVRLLFSFVVLDRIGENAFDDPESTSDAGQYVGLAKSILHTGTFTLYGEAHSFRAPLYPLWLAFWYQLSHSWFFSVAVTGSILGAVTAALTYRIGLALFSRSVGLGAAWFFALEPYGAHMAARPMTETLYAFLIACAALCVLALYQSHQRRPAFYAVLLGVMVGFAVLVRPQMWPFYIVVVTTFILATFRKKVSFMVAGAFFASAILIVMPWLVRNKILFGIFDVSSQGGWNLYFYDAKRFTGSDRFFGKTDVELRAWLEERLGRPGPSDIRSLVYQPVYTDAAFKIIKQNPAKFFLWHARESLIFFVDDGIRDMLRHAGIFPKKSLGLFGATLLWRVVWISIFIAASYGVWRARRQSHLRYQTFLFALSILYVPAVAGTLAVARFRYSVTPMLLVLAVYGISVFLKGARPHAKQ